MLVDGADGQLDLVEAEADAFGLEVTVVLDIIHVVEYLWKAAHVFHRGGNPEMVMLGVDASAGHSQGRAKRAASSTQRAPMLAGTTAGHRTATPPRLMHVRTNQLRAIALRYLTAVLGRMPLSILSLFIHHPEQTFPAWSAPAPARSGAARPETAHARPLQSPVPFEARRFYPFALTNSLHPAP